ncbi:MAG: PorT family protein [Prolixibacteraceae bacterium]|nr:PorT family protein [Prolixibacteraceae bacterium]
MNLFRKILFCLFFLLFFSPIFSQEISIHGGVNISQIKLFYFDAHESPLIKAGFQLGPCINIPINKTLSVESAILYSTKGFRHKHTDLDETVTIARLNLVYLETPLALKVKIFSRDLTLYGFGGVYFAPALFGTLYGMIEDEDSFREQITWEKGATFSLKRFDYGAKMGFEVQKDKFRLGITYALGLANLSYTTTAGYNRTLDLYIGYQLFDKN